MTFGFVENTIIDRNTIKLIRSQAAKGRNVGKKHPSRGRRATIKADIAKSDYKTEHLDSRNHHMVLPTIELQFEDSLSVFPLPVESTPESRTPVQKAFEFLISVPHKPGLGNAIDFSVAGSIWIQFWFVDEAYFHCFIATSIAAKNLSTTNPEDSTEGLSHLSDSLRLVNQRLSEGEALSDMTLASVVSMLQYERMCGQYYQALIHFRGLQQMVELRGGISQLMKEKPELAQKISRADLEFAIYLGSSTRFSVDDVPGVATLNWLRERLGTSQISSLLTSQSFVQLNPRMKEVWTDIMSLTWFLNENVDDSIKMDGYTYHDTLILILISYRLVDIRPLNADPANSLENIIHVRLLMIMANFLLSLMHRLPDLPLLRQQIGALVQEEFTDDAENK
ncbi:hypothetical protein F4813DRAFT_352993 [Daldinia decipiens]|uniref:uncharacterized protein n=1 Tax=Daldinia decipiens TaxID=326647 RepID=UPI0020C34B80|nr:uncharacterized protein F4813DRAFT_352993 [Daldinia decipiens]KAI1659439.1 hypothetical protein F4813DRAFT_352993 [Daldinia decipiens]